MVSLGSEGINSVQIYDLSDSADNNFIYNPCDMAVSFPLLHNDT